MTGILTKDGVDVNGVIFSLPIRGTDTNGFSEVLIDATEVGGKGVSQRQSIEPYIGMKVEFQTNNDKYGFNFKIINP